MSALLFLSLRQIRNSIRSILRRPGKLIPYLVSLALLVWMFADFAMEPPKSRGLSDIRILHGIFIAWLLFMGIPILLTSLKSGAAVFRMSDVNLLFVSPLSPRRIMIYGLFRQMGGTLFSFVFMLFYCRMLTDHFAMRPTDVVYLVAGTAVFVLLVQVLSLLFYSFIRGSGRRKAFVESILYAGIGMLVLAVLGIYLKRGATAEAALSAASSPYLELFPFVGWTKGAVFALIVGNVPRFLLFLAALAVSFLLCILLFFKSSPDYYEDVLGRAEKTFSAKQALRDRRSGADSGRKPGKVGKTGLGGGWGASAFFYKHLCEARRRSRIPFPNRSTLVLLLANGVVCFIMIISSKRALSPAIAMAANCALSVYLLFFFNAAGDWTRELAKPYLYLAPDPPFRKLIWASMTTILKPVVDGALIFTVIGVAVKADFLTALICFLIYASFGFFFTAASVLAQRVFGGMANKGIVLFLYMILLAVMEAPGIAGMICSYFLFRNGAAALLPFWIGLPDVLWNTLLSVLIFYACRNLLGSAEN